MAWQENKPTGTDLLKELPAFLRSQATTIRTFLEQHFYWTQSSGASAGVPLLSDGSAGPGSARAFYGPQSEVSAAPSGKLMVTSNTSRLFGLTSDSSHLLGSRLAIVRTRDGASVETITAGTRWLAQ